MRVLCPLVLAVALPIALQDDQADARLEIGREHCELLYAASDEALWGRLSTELRGHFGGEVAGWTAVRERLMTQVGAEEELLSEKLHDLPGGFAYVRLARFEKVEAPLELLWQFDAGEKVTVLRLAPPAKEAESRFLDYSTKTALRLPFDGSWDVFWGGRQIEQNYHTAYPDQRFAYDLLIVRDGKSHSGEGVQNDDYFCFGKRLYSPGGGLVVSVANDVEDNVPGEMNPSSPLGNHVILDHGNGEFSFMAHFKEGTVEVTAGQEVAAGAFLGLAGNSGNSSEPHLHYHLQTTPEFNAGEGLPSQFLNYVADGQPVARGEPVKGEVIAHGTQD